MKVGAIHDSSPSLPTHPEPSTSSRSSSLRGPRPCASTGRAKAARRPCVRQVPTSASSRSLERHHRQDDSQALTSPALSYGHSAGRIETKAQFIAYLESKASAFRKIELSEQR